MISAVAQTLANILVKDSLSIEKSQIDFSHPGEIKDIKPALNLYLYDLKQSNKSNLLERKKCGITTDYSNHYPKSYREISQIGDRVFWYELSFAIIALDWTNIGEQHLLSEALSSLLKHQTIDEADLPLELRGYGNLSLEINTSNIDVMQFWRALKLPLKPALYVTVRSPFGAACQDSNLISQAKISTK